MEDEEKVVKYKVVQQIDVYKKNSFTNTKFINEYKSKEDSIRNEIPYNYILSLLSKSREYNVIFPKQTTYYENYNNSKVVVEDLRKIIIKLRSIQKILQLANIDNSEIFKYILFYENIINLETTDDNMTIYNINYDKLINILNCFNIKHNDKEFSMNKNSLKKIIEMCGITSDERFRYLNIAEITV